MSEKFVRWYFKVSNAIILGWNKIFNKEFYEYLLDHQEETDTTNEGIIKLWKEMGCIK